MELPKTTFRSKCLVCHEDFVCQFNSEERDDDVVVVGSESDKRKKFMTLMWDTFFQCFNVESPSTWNGVKKFFSRGEQLPFCGRCQTQLKLLKKYKERQDSMALKIKKATSTLQELMNQSHEAAAATPSTLNDEGQANIEIGNSNLSDNLLPSEIVVFSSRNVDQELSRLRKTILKEARDQHKEKISLRIVLKKSSQNDNTEEDPGYSTPMERDSLSESSSSDSSESSSPSSQADKSSETSSVHNDLDEEENLDEDENSDQNENSDENEESDEDEDLDEDLDDNSRARSSGQSREEALQEIGKLYTDHETLRCKLSILHHRRNRLMSPRRPKLKRVVSRIR